MSILAEITLKPITCTPTALFRFYHPSGGWTYVGTDSRITERLGYTNRGVFVSQLYSTRSRIERVTDRDFKQEYTAAFYNLNANEKDAVLGMLEAEKVEWLKDDLWVRVYLPRQAYTLKDRRSPSYSLEITFEIKDYVQ